KLVVQLSNCAPRKLNVFLKTLQAKLEIMLSQCPKAGLKGPRTPVNILSQRLEGVYRREGERKVALFLDWCVQILPRPLRLARSDRARFHETSQAQFECD
ncbi:hypothetical protein Y032_0096g2871, partial [Ancylostoma ceylanicum]